MLTLKRQTMTRATVDWQVQHDSSRRISFCPLKSKELRQWKIHVRKGRKKAPEGCRGLRDEARLWNPLHQADIERQLRRAGAECRQDSKVTEEEIQVAIKVWHTCVKLILVSHGTGHTLKSQKGNTAVLLYYHNAKPPPDYTKEPGHRSYYGVMVPLTSFVPCFVQSVLLFSAASSVQKGSAALPWTSYGQSTLGCSEVRREESLL